ncbi:hypothetical protein JTP67_34020, partial [Streptomyces sp. S12]|nr:hypothetical protein [Streptomyces sp. S12]
TTVTLDGWEIKRTNEINVESTSAAVAAGRTIRSDNNLPGVPNSGTLLAAQAAYVNSASTTVRGIDLDARQRFDLGSAGRLNLDLQWSHISKFERE